MSAESPKGPAPVAPTVEDQLITSIHEATLASTVAALRHIDDGSPEVADASAALAAIGRDGVAALDDVASALRAAGIGHRFEGPVADARTTDVPELARIAIDVLVDADDAEAAVAAVVRLGYRPWHDLDAGSWAAYRRLYPALALVADTDRGHPVVLQVVWAPPGRARVPAPLAVLAQRLRRFRPTPEDLGRPHLPARLWWAHVALGPARSTWRRLRRRPAPRALGPYLPTPVALIDALLDVAGVGPDDVVADLGCGDGRVLVRAALRGCRAIGVEHDPGLVRRARDAAARAGVAERVEVVAGDVAAFDVGRATVVVLFVAAPSLPDVVDDLRRRLAPGSRIVAHEQAPVASVADARRPLFTTGGITVAHRWDL
ncbi:MAG: methyltransferase domain-containing protein [Actinomycetota bacterium]|nr:methyltransferase domain-containing protein [Actinomycetota bacterium]